MSKPAEDVLGFLGVHQMDIIDPAGGLCCVARLALRCPIEVEAGDALMIDPTAHVS